jgi:hypothetical protein
MAACAAYAAVLRYATRGRDEYPIAPRNVAELRAVLYVEITRFLCLLLIHARLLSDYIVALPPLSRTPPYQSNLTPTTQPQYHMRCKSKIMIDRHDCTE